MRDLRDGFAARPADPDECRREAAAALLRVAVDPYLGEAALQGLDPETRMADVAAARGRSLKSFGVLELAAAYAAAGGDRRKFGLLLREQRSTLAWTSPPVIRVVDHVFEELARLDDLNFNVTWSRRYENDGWMVDVRSAWYPTKAQAHLFLIATSDCSSGVKSAILNLSGPVHVPGGARLAEATYEVRCCETRLSGEWTDGGGVSSFRSGESLVASSLSLKIVGREVEGRLVQSVGGRDVRGKVVYVLTGRAVGDRLEGTFQATGDPQALRLVLGVSTSSAVGTWSGTLADGQAQGTLSLDGGAVNWRAQVVPSGD